MKPLQQMPQWLAGLVFAVVGMLVVRYAEISTSPTLTGLLMLIGIILGFALLTKLK